MAESTYIKRAARAIFNRELPDSRALHAILIKPVSDHCNLRCTYCYEGTNENRFPQPRMNVYTLERTIRTSIEQATGSIEFIWHGGEPLLAGLDFFETGMRLQNKYRKNDLRVYNSIQTNGLLINDEWISFFLRHDFSVGVSFDGPAELHDLFRVDSKQQGSHSRVISALARLANAGIPLGVISVIHTEHVGKAAEYLAEVERHEIHHLDIHPAFGKETEVSKPIQPRDFSDFAIELFEVWLENGNADIRFNLFDDFLRGYFFRSPDTCYFAGTCTKIVAVEANGDVVPCTRPFDRALYSFGNIQLASLKQIKDGHKLSAFMERDLQSQQKASACKWAHLCHNGCPQHRVDNDGKQDIAGNNYYCECTSGIPGGHASIWNHIEARLGELFDS